MSNRVVYDTMVLLQAAARPDRLHATMRAVQEGKVDLCLSDALTAEVEGLLNRPNIQAKFPAINPASTASFIGELLKIGSRFDTVPAMFTWPLHPDDDHLFNLAIHAQVDFLVTWETRLLKLPGSPDAASIRLNELAPRLKLITPKDLADLLRQ